MLFFYILIIKLLKRVSQVLMSGRHYIIKEACETSGRHYIIKEACETLSSRQIWSFII
jgi:uncharacterized protein YlzI (FlbEa/FlbD family)